MESGLAFYTIETDGCLNGVFTNDALDGVIYNEIAKKNSNIGEDPLCGLYDCFYFDSPDLDNRVELSIDTESWSKTGRSYAFIWFKKGKKVFQGTGYKMNEGQVVVHYVSV